MSYSCQLRESRGGGLCVTSDGGGARPLKSLWLKDLFASEDAAFRLLRRTHGVNRRIVACRRRKDVVAFTGDATSFCV